MPYFRLAAVVFYFIVILEKAKSLKCYKCEENVDGHCVLKNASSFMKCEDFYRTTYGGDDLACFEMKIHLKLRPSDDDDNSEGDDDNKGEGESEKDIELKSCTLFEKWAMMPKLKAYSESHDNEPFCIKLDMKKLNSPIGTFDVSFDKFMLKHYNGDETIERSMIKKITGEICYCIRNFCNVKYIDEEGSSGENLSTEKNTKSGTAISISGAQPTGGSDGNMEKVNSSSEMSGGVKSTETVSNRSSKVFKSVTMGVIFGFIFVFYLISM